MRKCIIFILITAIVILSSSSCNYLYVGDGWQDTPEAALAVAADNPMEKDILTAKNIIDTLYIGDRAFMLFVSEGDTLVSATFVTNEDGKYHYNASSEEVLLNEPDTFLLNGDSEQFILFPYQQYGNKCFGWKLSSAQIKINGIEPEIKTYQIECQGKMWSVDYWCVDNISGETEILIEHIK